MKLLKSCLFFLVARIVRMFLFFHNRKIDVAFISNFRNKDDVINFGFFGKLPDVFPWIFISWQGFAGRLFMIGSTTDHIAGTASLEEKNNAKKQCWQAVEESVRYGAKVVLFGAGTKRLLAPDDLKEKFPSVIFSIGDNYTSLLLEKKISQVVKRYNIQPGVSRVVVIAPYGHLGKTALEYLVRKKFVNVYGIGPSHRQSELICLRERYNIHTLSSVEFLTSVDLIITCGSGSSLNIKPELLSRIKRVGSRLSIIDPCEPTNLHGKVLPDDVDCYDAGNAQSANVSFFPPYSNFLFGLKYRELWGCFAEAFVVCKHGLFSDWMHVTSDNKKTLEEYINEKDFIDPPLPM